LKGSLQRTRIDPAWNSPTHDPANCLHFESRHRLPRLAHYPLTEPLAVRKAAAIPMHMITRPMGLKK
jgi:hypothetical protein